MAQTATFHLKGFAGLKELWLDQCQVTTAGLGKQGHLTRAGDHYLEPNEDY